MSDEPGGTTTSPTTGPASPLPADAPAQITAIRADPEHPLNPLNHHGNPDLRRQLDNLYRAAYPDEGQPAKLEPAAPTPDHRADGLPTLGDVLEAVPEPPGGWTPHADDLAHYLVAPINRLEKDSQEAAGLAYQVLTLMRRAGAFQTAGPVVPAAPGSADADLEKEWGGPSAFERNLELGANALRRAFPDPTERARG